MVAIRILTDSFATRPLCSLPCVWWSLPTSLSRSTRFPRYSRSQRTPSYVYTSNIFAILGLRSLYFLLGAIVKRFDYLSYSLALILIFIGGKVLISNWLGEVTPAISLMVTLLILAGGILVSLWKERAVRRQGNAH
jgi:predicted tellurium resistance membrane protein TerC